MSTCHFSNVFELLIIPLIVPCFPISLIVPSIDRISSNFLGFTPFFLNYFLNSCVIWLFKFVWIRNPLCFSLTIHILSNYPLSYYFNTLSYIWFSHLIHFKLLIIFIFPNLFIRFFVPIRLSFNAALFQYFLLI